MENNHNSFQFIKKISWTLISLDTVHFFLRESLEYWTKIVMSKILVRYNYASEIKLRVNGGN
jgi:hypothetical protein